MYYHLTSTTWLLLTWISSPSGSCNMYHLQCVHHTTWWRQAPKKTIACIPVHPYCWVGDLTKPCNFDCVQCCMVCSTCQLWRMRCQHSMHIYIYICLKDHNWCQAYPSCAYMCSVSAQWSLNCHFHICISCQFLITLRPKLVYQGKICWALPIKYL